MKRFLAFSMFILIAFVGKSQKQTKLDLSLRHLETNYQKLGLVKEDIKDMNVNFQAEDENGIGYVFFQQTVNGITIKNALLNITTKNGKVAHIGNNFVENKMSKVVNAADKLNATQGLSKAMEALGIVGHRLPTVSKRESNKVEFSKSSFSDNLITAEKKYDLVGDKLIPVWEYAIDLNNNADYWEIRMDRNSGAFVSKNNLTLYCNHEHDSYTKKHSGCGIEAHQEMKEQSVSVTSALNAQASYKVYALPAESPSHGPHKIVEDPAFVETSPFGWHDTDGVAGPEFTFTKGNNVDAFVDKNDDNAKDADVAQPNGGSNLSFNFSHDKSKETSSSIDAVQTNLFYMTNMMHDITALYGFSEEWANFQTKNYSSKGKGNDHVVAQALDGFDSTPRKVNNANFSTPPDGQSGSMQMFLWTSPVAGVRIDAPANLAGEVVEYGTAEFGSQIPGPTGAPVTGKIAIATYNNLSSPTLCCGPINEDLKGKIALIDRGLCGFSEKAKYAEDKGAIGVIICNVPGINGGTGEETTNMSASAVAPKSLVSIFMKNSDCNRIRASINDKIDVVMTMKQFELKGPQYLDGSFDNGIIAHEFGHGVSNRLTGGGIVTSCLTNEEQMGEGWSDFLSLVTTVEPGDRGDDARGIGTYAEGQPVTGRGIRSFPYSTDMSINPLTFNNIKGLKNAQGVVRPHAVGEIWTACLWDMYWKMVDKYGYDANWRNKNSGNAKALSLVIQGMKIQGCGPGFIRGRNAILASDTLLFGGVNAFDIWDVFARRGLGYNAKGGNPNNIDDGTENFETNPYKIELLKIQKEDVELVKPSSIVNIKLNSTNHFRGTQTDVQMSDVLPVGFSFIDGSSKYPAKVEGNKVFFNVGSFPFDKKDTLTYKVKATSQKSTSFKKYGFNESEEDWVIDALIGTNAFQLTDVAVKSGNQSFFIFEEDTKSDQVLQSPSFKVNGSNPALRFWHRYDSELTNDGGFIEISTDGGLAWTVIRDGFIKNGYNSAISYNTVAIPSLNGFSGSSNEKFIDTYLDLSKWKNQNIKIRFRFVTNETVSSSATFKGWFIDDVELLDLVYFDTQACIANGKSENGSCSEIRRIIMDTDATTPTKDLPTALSKVEFYPNPVSNILNLDIVASKITSVNITIVQIDGKNIYSEIVKIGQGANSKQIDLSNVPSGVYLINILDGESLTSKKLVVQH
jgi:extracellular elastinolytic metalloproteinase